MMGAMTGGLGATGIQGALLKPLFTVAALGNATAATALQATFALASVANSAARGDIAGVFLFVGGAAFGETSHGAKSAQLERRSLAAAQEVGTGVTGGSPSALPRPGVGDLQPGDVLLTGDGGLAKYLKGTGEYGHGAMVLRSESERLEVLSSDARGIYIRDNSDPAVGGRTFDVFRTEDVSATDLRAFARGVATEGGLGQYFGNAGGNVCASVCTRGLEAAGELTIPRLVGRLVTPNGLGRALGPPIGRIRVPLLRTAP